MFKWIYLKAYIFQKKVMVLWNADISQLKYRMLSACRLTTNLLVLLFLKWYSLSDHEKSHQLSETLWMSLGGRNIA